MVGLGQMASVLGFGFLRLGRPVVPVTRTMSMATVASEVPSPELVVIAVGERELKGVLRDLPDAWRDRVALLQNELRPSTWQPHALEGPTILSAWFEKKKGMDVRVLRASSAFGPGAPLFCSALGAIDVPCTAAAPEDLVHELARKNLYILTVNIAGLIIDVSVGVLWKQHRRTVDEVFEDLFRLEERLLGTSLDRAEQERSLAESIEAAPERRARGRTAAERLARVLDQAQTLNLSLPSLSEIPSNT